jgi:hypothetical protein
MTGRATLVIATRAAATRAREEVLVILLFLSEANSREMRSALEVAKARYSHFSLLNSARGN